MKIGHYQCECKQGDFDANLDTVIHGLELAQESGLAIVSFPESFLTGYFSGRSEAWRNSFAVDSNRMKEVLMRTRRYEPLFMVGFNERRGESLYNTVAVIERGRILGTYSKAFPCYDYFTPGREFPVFCKDGLRFGVIICADGGYIEPARILAIKGALIVFAPHFNCVKDPIQHYQMVRNDHVARAVENGIYFLRGNNVIRNTDPNLGFGYGDSYLLNPNGEIVAAAGLYCEYLMMYDLDLNKPHRSKRAARSIKSANSLLDLLARVIREE